MRRAWRSLVLVVLCIGGVVLAALSNTVTSLVPMLAATALVMGGTFNPRPDQSYVDNQTSRYIVGFFDVDGQPKPVNTPEEFFPFNGTMTFDESVARGVQDLDDQMRPYAGESIVILGYSQSTRIASIKKRNLIEEHGSDFDSYPDVSFVLVSNVNKGNGGILKRFDGITIPFLGVTMDGATSTNSPENPHVDGDYALDTKDITYLHDGWSDFPIYPGNLLALANAIAGIEYLHSTYPTVENPQLTPQGSYGDTDYYVIETDIVPLLIPLERAGVPRPILLAVDEPLRVMIEAGYRRDINPGQPTPAYLIPIGNPISLTANLVRSVPVGIDDALDDIGLGRALGTSPSGPYGVGGEDEDLKGLPPGLIPLGRTSDATQTTTPAPVNKPAPKQEPTAELQTAVPEVEAKGEDDGTNLTTHNADDTTAPSNPTPNRPKTLRPKVRGPIDFDVPKPPSLRPSGDRPAKRLFNALTGQRPEPGAEAVESEDDQKATPSEDKGTARSDQQATST
jgi:hypothetical protein